MTIKPDPKRTAKTGKARYVCMGERIEAILETGEISPSARNVLPLYHERVKEILGSREDGAPDWEASWDKSQALVFLERKDEYDPLMVEIFFWEEGIMAEAENRNRFMVRGTDGEIHATDEGVRVCTEIFLKELDAREADLKNPPRSAQPESYPFYLFATLLTLGSNFYHPKATRTLSPGQRETVGNAIRKAYSIFDPYFEQAPEGEIKDYWVDFLEAYVNQFNNQGQIDQGAQSGSLSIDFRYFPSFPTIQEGLSRSYAFSSSPVVAYAFQTMLEKSSWRESSMGEQYYPAISEENKQLTYLLACRDMGRVETVKGDEAKIILRNLGLETALLHAQFANYCYQTTKDGSANKPAYATADQLIKFLSLNEKKKKDPKTGKRTRLSREEQIQTLKKYLHSLGALHVRFEGKARDGRTWKSEIPEPLWIVSLRETSQILLGTEIPDMNVTMDFITQVTPGPWSQMERSHKPPYLLYRYIPGEILDFDQQKERWGACWVFWTSCHIGPGGYNKFSIRALLEIVLSPEEIQSLGEPANRKERHDAVNKIENNLKAMESHGWKIKRSKEYSRAMGEDGGRRSRNYFQDLLESTVVITPPRASETLKPIFPQQQEGNPPLLAEGKKEHLTGANFKKQREKIGFSQKDAGRAIIKSQSFISLVEKGERNLSEEDTKKWKKVMEDYHGILRTEGD